MPNNTKAVTPQMIDALRLVIDALHDTLIEAGERGVPDGHVYAVAQDVLGMSLGAWQGLKAIMIGMGIMRESGHVLYHACNDDIPIPDGQLPQ